MRFFTATCLIISVALAGCGGGSTTAGTATAVAAEPATAVNNEGSVTSMGNNQVGQTLTAVVADLDGASGTISYQWFADGFAVDGASAETYDLTGTDVNIDIRVRASYTDDNGFIESPLSDSNGPVFAASGLDPNVPPGQNFDLLGWKLNTPEADSRGLANKIDEVDLAAGYTDADYFWTGADGGMVFRVTNAGATTSANASYPRTELREMLRRGNTSISTRGSDGSPNLNNWVFSSAPASAQASAGAVDGELKATLAVNVVTTSGSSSRVGRLVVGQIHAKDDEPVRLYYRKLPGHQRGAIYAAHEINGGDDIYYEIVGSKSSSASDPENGIALDEIWSYDCLLYTSPSPRDRTRSRMPSSA